MLVPNGILSKIFNKSGFLGRVIKVRHMIKFGILPALSLFLQVPTLVAWGPDIQCAVFSLATAAGHLGVRF